MTAEEKLPSLVMVDDDPDDCFLFKRALQENGFANKVVFLADGQELMDYLNGQVKSAKGSLESQVVLLDLNMPRLDGREALRRIKDDEALKKMPVVILTTSKNPEDVQNAYGLGASSFFSKPSDYRELVYLFKVLKEYWMGLVVLPS
jgi:CheY-like chemotaxis protein